LNNVPGAMKGKFMKIKSCGV